MQILLSHPHVAAVARGFAAGFERANMLSGFFTGISFQGSTWTGRFATRLARRRPVISNRILFDVSSEHLHSLSTVELTTRVMARLLAKMPVAISTYDALFLGHDLAVAAASWPSGTTDVFAYEDGALMTFRKARDLGLGRIWDLPLPHYHTLDELYIEEARRWCLTSLCLPSRPPEWKRRRKDGELDLATKISVASKFTRSSLHRFEIRQPVIVVPYGFPVDEFAPRSRAPQGPFTVLAVGTHDLRKGTPYLLEAWRLASLPYAELHLVGPLRLPQAFLDRFAGLFRHWPYVPKRELQARYAGADLLAFPTLGDGFGLVMQEAMCTGTPVMTTSCGGGPECITDGVDGWIIAARSVDSIVEILRSAAKNRDHVYAMGQSARRRAEQWTWRDAQDRLSKLLSS